MTLTGSSGIGLVELYDLSRSADSKLANISIRGVASSAADVLIGGFILGGQTPTPGFWCAPSAHPSRKPE
jgi:hypothetical protein